MVHLYCELKKLIDTDDHKKTVKNNIHVLLNEEDFFTLVKGKITEHIICNFSEYRSGCLLDYIVGECESWKMHAVSHSHQNM